MLDAAEAEEAFQQTGNPFALLVAAHRAALLTRRDPERRAEERFRLIRYLLRRKWPRAEVANLFKLVSWMTKLPPELELKFKEKVDTLRIMEPDLTIDELPLPIEMIWLEQGMEKGIQQGLERGIQKGRAAGMLEAQRLSILSALEARFGLAPEAARLQVDRLATEEQLSQALRLAVTSPSLEEFLKSV